MMQAPSYQPRLTPYQQALLIMMMQRQQQQQMQKPGMEGMIKPLLGATGLKEGIASLFGGGSGAAGSMLSATAPGAAAEAYASGAIGNMAAEAAALEGASFGGTAGTSAATTAGTAPGLSPFASAAIPLAVLSMPLVMKSIVPKLMGHKPARQMSEQEIGQSSGNLKHFLGSDDPGTLKRAMDAGLLRRSMTKRDAGKDFSERDAFYGPQFSIFDSHKQSQLYKKMTNKQRLDAGFSGIGGVGSGSLQKQLEFMDKNPSFGWDEETKNRAAAARGILGNGSGAPVMINGQQMPAWIQPMPRGGTPNPKFQTDPGFNMNPEEMQKLIGQFAPNGSVTGPWSDSTIPTAPARSSTRSPGIGLDGRPIQYRR